MVHLDPGEFTLTTMMRRLRSAYDVRSLLCEGGPTLFGALLGEDLVDELFLSLAPKLTGGGMAPGITQRTGARGAAQAVARVGARARQLAVPALRTSLNRFT